MTFLDYLKTKLLSSTTHSLYYFLGSLRYGKEGMETDNGDDLQKFQLPGDPHSNPT